MSCAPVDLADGAARVTILPSTGGAVAAFAWQGVNVLRPMPPEAAAARDVRLASCYPLLPYSNRIRDAALDAGGARHALRRNFGDHPHAIHGVGWQREWTTARIASAVAQLGLEHTATGEARAAWPWPFAATQTFALADAGTHAMLAVTLTIRNTGAGAFPFGLGWHPFLPRSATATLQFDADGWWHNDATQLPVTWKPTVAERDFAHPRVLEGTPLDTVFTGWRGRAVLEDTHSGLRTTVGADSACAFLVVYAPPARDFVAIEPVTHETDAFNRSAHGESATGTRWLPPGAGFSCTMRITVEHLDAA